MTKVLPNGDIFYVDSLTHNAVLLSPNQNMKELKKIPGKPIPESVRESAPSFNKTRRTCFSDAKNSDYQIYFNGLNNLSLINLQTFETNEIENFFTWNGQWCFAMMAVAEKSFSKFFGIGYQGE